MREREGLAGETKRRALVADPDREARAHVVALLERAAKESSVTLTIDEAADGTTAMAIWSEHRPDLVVCEVLLEGVGGLALLRRMLAELGKLPPVVLVTSLTRESDRYWGLRNGAHAYVRKPFDEELLVKRMATLLVEGAAAPADRVSL